MEKTNREIRALLSSMAPARAALLHVSVDGLAKIRRRAYAKIADDMQG